MGNCCSSGGAGTARSPWRERLKPPPPRRGESREFGGWEEAGAEWALCWSWLLSLTTAGIPSVKRSVKILDDLCNVHKAKGISCSGVCSIFAMCPGTGCSNRTNPPEHTASWVVKREFWLPVSPRGPRPGLLGKDVLLRAPRVSETHWEPVCGSREVRAFLHC